MNVEIAYLPRELAPIDLRDRIAVVFDVLRATTTMITALANTAVSVCAFGTLEEAAAAHTAFADAPKLLAGERRMLRPDGFDLGNSPEAFTCGRVGGRVIFMATTNGTVAVRACATAARTFVGSLCNGSAIAGHLAGLGRDVVLVCAGTDGVAGIDDIAGAATVAALLRRQRGDVTLSPRLEADIDRASATTRDEWALRQLLHASAGGRNLHGAGLSKDVDFAARVDRFPIVAEVTHAARYAVVRAVNVPTVLNPVA